MSGLEFVGAFAATAQLFGHLLDLANALLEIRDHINHVSIRVQTYRERLESLARTVQYIHAHPPLLTQVVSELLQIISQRVSSLNDILRKSFTRTPRGACHRLMRVYTEKTAERRIRELLENLDSYKIDLAICVSGARQMATGHVEVERMGEEGGILLEETPQNKEIATISKALVPRADSFGSNSSADTAETIIEDEAEPCTSNERAKYDVYKDTVLEDYDYAVVGLAGGEQTKVRLRIENTRSSGGKMIVVGRASQNTADRMTNASTTTASVPRARSRNDSRE